MHTPGLNPENTHLVWTDSILSLDNTGDEALNQFLEEIELMKAIGTHPNVVRMLGCWVHSDPIFLLLEYVPYGDLLHWLRNKRIQVSGLEYFSRRTLVFCVLNQF